MQKTFLMMMSVCVFVVTACNSKESMLEADKASVSRSDTLMQAVPKIGYLDKVIGPEKSSSGTIVDRAVIAVGSQEGIVLKNTNNGKITSPTNSVDLLASEKALLSGDQETKFDDGWVFNDGGRWVTGRSPDSRYNCVTFALQAAGTDPFMWVDIAGSRLTTHPDIGGGKAVNTAALILQHSYKEMFIGAPNKLLIADLHSNLISVGDGKTLSLNEGDVILFTFNTGKVEIIIHAMIVYKVNQRTVAVERLERARLGLPPDRPLELGRRFANAQNFVVSKLGGLQTVVTPIGWIFEYYNQDLLNQNSSGISKIRIYRPRYE